MFSLYFDFFCHVRLDLIGLGSVRIQSDCLREGFPHVCLVEKSLNSSSKGAARFLHFTSVNYIFCYVLKQIKTEELGNTYQNQHIKNPVQYAVMPELMARWLTLAVRIFQVCG